MNERERWIVYPLLFFALGASLRDKFLQHVETKELECTSLVAKEILCEELSILDPVKQDRIVAKLMSGEPTGPQRAENNDRFGVLLLFDSEGQELCGVTNNQLRVRQIGCEQVLAQIFAVLSPDNPGDVLAGLSSVVVPPGTAGRGPRRVGVLELNKQQLFGVRGNPVPAAAEPRELQAPAMTGDDDPAAEADDDGATPDERPRNDEADESEESPADSNDAAG